jgi:hypothetical protein
MSVTAVTGKEKIDTKLFKVKVKIQMIFKNKLSSRLTGHFKGKYLYRDQYLSAESLI